MAIAITSCASVCAEVYLQLEGQMSVCGNSIEKPQNASQATASTYVNDAVVIQSKNLRTHLWHSLPLVPVTPWQQSDIDKVMDNQEHYCRILTTN